MNIFEISGKIAIDCSSALKDLENLGDEAKETASDIGDIDEASDKAGGGIDDLTNKTRSSGDGFTIFKGIIANLASGAIQKLISGLATLASKIVEVTKKAVGNYANYEQLAGGAQLMFGDAYDYIAEKAEKAYKTVQLSQNDYLEQVNGFAVGLKTALGGNSQAAAELADKIVQAEADIVAATGKTQESVQDAFNGVMRGNYEMLDNLGLGIAGSKEGLQSVIDKVNEWKAANGEAATYTIDNLADCQQALVDYVEMQGLAGYASGEASTTITGSWASVQAMFENILTKVGSALAPVVMDFLNKVSDWLDSVDWDAVAQQISDALQPMVEWAENQNLSDMLDKVLEFVMQLIESLPTIIPVITSILEIIPVIITNLDTIIPIIEILTGCIIALNIALNGNPIMAIITLIITVIGFLITLWMTNEDFRNTIIGIWEGIKTFFITIWEAIKLAFTTAWDVIVTVWNGAVWFFTTIWQGIQFAFSTVFEFFSTIFTNAWNSIVLVWDTVVGFFQGIWDGICGVFSTVANWFTDKFTTAWNNIKSVWGGVTGFFSGVWTGITQVFGNVAGWFRDTFRNAWQAVMNVFSAGGEIFSGIVNGVVTTFKSVVNALIDGINSVVAIPFNGINTLLNSIKSVDILGLKPFDWIWTLPVPQIPHLATGGVLERGQVGLLEGDGAEAVVPLEKNTEWISRVAEQMNVQQAIKGNESSMQISALLESNKQTNYLLEAMIDRLNTVASIIKATGEKDIVLDSGVLVGELTPAIDSQLGLRMMRGGR